MSVKESTSVLFLFFSLHLGEVIWIGEVSSKLQKSVLMHGQSSNHSLSFNDSKWLCWNIRTALPVMNLVALAHPTMYLNKLVSGKFGFLEHSERKKSRKSMLLSLVFYFSFFTIYLQLIKRGLCFIIWLKHGKRQNSSCTVFKGETWRWKIRRILPKTPFYWQFLRTLYALSVTVCTMFSDVYDILVL